MSSSPVKLFLAVAIGELFGFFFAWIIFWSPLTSAELTNVNAAILFVAFLTGGSVVAGAVAKLGTEGGDTVVVPRSGPFEPDRFRPENTSGTEVEDEEN